jgi:chloramphenicol O-acetyltransferase
MTAPSKGGWQRLPSLSKTRGQKWGNKQVIQFGKYSTKAGLLALPFSSEYLFIMVLIYPQKL